MPGCGSRTLLCGYKAAFGSSHLNHRARIGEEAVPQKEGRAAGRQVEFLSPSEVPKMCCQCPQGLAGILVKSLFLIFAQVPSFLPKYIHKSPWE